MKETVFRYGENNRGFGITTLPEDPDSAPVAVLLNAWQGELRFRLPPVAQDASWQVEFSSAADAGTALADAALTLPPTSIAVLTA